MMRQYSVEVFWSDTEGRRRVRVHREPVDRDTLSPDMNELIGPIAAKDKQEALATALLAGIHAFDDLRTLEHSRIQRAMTPEGR